MSSAAIITIAVGALVVLAAIALVTFVRKSDVRGAGALSRETKRRDRDADIDLPPAVSGRAVERAAAEEQRGGGLATMTAAPPVVWTAPDREEIGVTRRQFL